MTSLPGQATDHEAKFEFDSWQGVVLVKSIWSHANWYFIFEPISETERGNCRPGLLTFGFCHVYTNIGCA